MQGKVKVEKLTGDDLLNWAFSRTAHGSLKIHLMDAYRWEHSPSYTQFFKIEMDGIALFASTHFLRHHVGVTGPYIRTQRPDRGGTTDDGRWSPHDHALICNAQTLINMSKVRLCYKASVETRAIMQAIKDGVARVDEALVWYMVPTCVYRGGLCPEPKTCGRLDKLMHRYAYYRDLFK
jgi:hypothetical protein